MKRMIYIIVALFIIAGAVRADNLFNINRKADVKDADKAQESPIDDLRQPPPAPIEEHELITVIIEEQVIGSGRTRTESDKRSRTEFSVDEWFHIRKGWKTVSPDSRPGVDTDARHRAENEGSSERRLTLRSKQQCMVMQVYPNGNLLIEGKKTITRGQESDIVILTGIIRSGDVYRGQISSTKVYDLKVVYAGKGPQTDASRPGWITRLFNKFWPF